MPKKFVGRFTKVDGTNSLTNITYGERRIVKGIDGIELLKEGADVAGQRILTDEDFKRIRIQKLKQAAKKVDRKGFRDSDDSEESERDKINNLSDMSDDEEGEEENSELEEEVP